MDFLEALFALPCPVITLVADLQSIIVDLERYPDAIYESPALVRIPKPATFHHASLVEFLLDRQRSLEFHIDVQQFDLWLFDLTLKNLQDPSRQQSLTSDEDYCFIVYSFALMLQTQASTLESSRQHVADELTKWDSFDDDILYCILEVLCLAAGDQSHNEENIAKFNMMLQPTLSTRTLFAEAVERKITQCYKILSSNNLSPVLFLLFYGSVATTGSLFPYRLPPSSNLQHASALYHRLGWHMLFHCGQHSNCNPWEFFYKQVPKPFRRYSFCRPV
ncbi:hypothetical protein CVT24_001145 [Panaeolus cyanescens]|uniref:Uncharacterized protein n=1 Tax=Panaeolus cyanescens TaxID=181874 RepID=A0A409WS56_9AGAR|nr:hypothetical protein CVT24_001145 [Panaeolus cyanescens]